MQLGTWQSSSRTEETFYQVLRAKLHSLAPKPCDLMHFVGLAKVFSLPSSLKLHKGRALLSTRHGLGAYAPGKLQDATPGDVPAIVLDLPDRTLGSRIPSWCAAV